METVTEYRERAEECRLMANQAFPKHRNALLKMAQVWEILAHDRRKKLLRRCPNIARTSQASRNAQEPLGAAWRDGCATGMREEAEEAAEIIKTSGLGDERELFARRSGRLKLI